MEVNRGNHPFFYSLVLVGSYGVGKTTIFARLSGQRVTPGRGEVHSFRDQCQKTYKFRQSNGTIDEVTVR